jgi:hypothetical protein
MSNKDNIPKLMAPPYVTHNNIYYTRCLFYEEWISLPDAEKKVQPIFTATRSRPGLIDARSSFVSLEDPTGYLWAIKYLGDWNHWLKMMNSVWFRNYVEDWKAEMHVSMQAKAIQKIGEFATLEGPSALAAAKYIAERGWEKTGKGRPSKEALAIETKKQAREEAVLDEDSLRIGLKVIPGGKHG